MSNAWLKQNPGKIGVESSEMIALREENDLLFSQLHVVQAELERRHYQGVGQQSAGVLKLVLDDSRFPEVVAESLRYRKALVARDDVHHQEIRQSLANRLGAAVIQGASRPMALLSMPGKLWSIWRDVKEYAPPTQLGGKSYEKVISAYREGGEAAVNTLLRDRPASVKANAMTVLARSLADTDAAGAARCARQAYELDPRPFRLKWLAFREHEAGRPEEGEALLDALPVDMNFSESEQRQIGIVRADAERVRGREVTAKYDYASRRREVEQKFQQLMQQRTQQQALLEQHVRQCADLDRERAVLMSELAKQKAVVLDVCQSRDALLQVHENLTREHKDLVRMSEVQLRESVEREALLMEQREHIEVLERSQMQWEEDRLSLIEQLEALQGDMQELSRAHDEKNTLVGQQQRYIEENDRLRAQWEQQCTALSERQSFLQKSVEALSLVRDEQAELLVRQIDLFGLILGQQHEVANGYIKRLDSSGTQLERQLRAVVKDETANANRQVQALIGLQGYYSSGELPVLNPEHNSWPVSPDFALYLVQLIEINHYDLIIEFGSGVSTVVIAKVLAQQEARRQAEGIGMTRFVSFEHLPSYLEQTLAHLQAAGVAEIVDLRLTPLHTWIAADSTPYSYYDCSPVLESLSRAQGQPLSILVVVDGPPAGVGKLARYPAAPMVKQFFSTASIDFVLDDYIREDEQRIAKLWQLDLEASGFTCQVTERRLEKGACLISASLEK